MTALPPNPRDWPEAALAFYVEQRAHREIDGRMPRARAEAAAEADVRAWAAAGGDEALLAALGRVPAECLPLGRNRPL